MYIYISFYTYNYTYINIHIISYHILSPCLLVKTIQQVPWLDLPCHALQRPGCWVVKPRCGRSGWISPTFCAVPGRGASL